jgi:hypothetical protein
MIADGLISEEWLKSVGFRWHQLERQPDKHWLLWLGGAIDGGMFTSFEDLGLELAPNAYQGRDKPRAWFCWLRGDTSHLYARFIHVRHLRTQEEVCKLVEALSGQDWNPENHWGGRAYTPDGMARLRKELNRFDHQLRENGHKWHDVEKDEARGGALPEHLQAHADQMRKASEGAKDE